MLKSNPDLFLNILKLEVNSVQIWFESLKYPFGFKSFDIRNYVTQKFNNFEKMCNLLIFTITRCFMEEGFPNSSKYS